MDLIVALATWTAIMALATWLFERRCPQRRRGHDQQRCHDRRRRSVRDEVGSSRTPLAGPS